MSISLETIDFEYRPNHYIEVSCAHSYVPSYSNADDKNKVSNNVSFVLVLVKSLIFYHKVHESVLVLKYIFCCFFDNISSILTKVCKSSTGTKLLYL